MELVVRLVQFAHRSIVCVSCLVSFPGGAPELAGYTTLILEYYPKFSRFRMSKQGPSR
jgi:hypothetical protein